MPKGGNCACLLANADRHVSSELGYDPTAGIEIRVSAEDEELTMCAAGSVEVDREVSFDTDGVVALCPAPRILTKRLQLLNKTLTELTPRR
jgi:hypothetical protein